MILLKETLYNLNKGLKEESSSVSEKQCFILNIYVIFTFKLGKLKVMKYYNFMFKAGS